MAKDQKPKLKRWDTSIDPATIPEDVLYSEVAKRNNAKRKTRGHGLSPGRPKVKCTCDICGLEVFGAQQIRDHAAFHNST